MNVKEGITPVEFEWKGLGQEVIVPIDNRFFRGVILGDNRELPIVWSREKQLTIGGLPVGDTQIVLFADIGVDGPVENRSKTTIDLNSRPGEPVIDFRFFRPDDVDPRLWLLSKEQPYKLNWDEKPKGILRSDQSLVLTATRGANEVSFLRAKPGGVLIYGGTPVRPSRVPAGLDETPWGQYAKGHMHAAPEYQVPQAL